MKIVEVHEIGAADILKVYENMNKEKDLTIKDKIENLINKIRKENNDG